MVISEEWDKIIGEKSINIELVSVAYGTGAANLSYNNNTEDTLFFIIALNGSNTQSYREHSSNLSAYSGCTPTSLDMKSTDAGCTYRIYRLDDCQSSVSLTATSYGSSNIYKLMALVKITQE